MCGRNQRATININLHFSNHGTLVDETDKCQVEPNPKNAESWVKVTPERCPNAFSRALFLSLLVHVLQATWMRVSVAWRSNSQTISRWKREMMVNDWIQSQKGHNGVHQQAKSNEVEFTRINIKFFGPAHLVRPGPELESMNRSGPTLGRKRQGSAQHGAWHVVNAPKC